MPITPDTKDWTWVLERVCPECGSDIRHFPRSEAGSMIRSNAQEWLEVLSHPQVRARPSDDVWSALEYGCHVRDVYRLYLERVLLMLERDHPRFANWDQDVTALQQRYGEQDPAHVGHELVDAADSVAAALDGLDESQWDRTGERSDGASFTVESLVRYMLHDPIHHLHDVRRGFERLG